MGQPATEQQVLVCVQMVFMAPNAVIDATRYTVVFFKIISKIDLIVKTLIVLRVILVEIAVIVVIVRFSPLSSIIIHHTPKYAQVSIMPHVN